MQVSITNTPRITNHVPSKNIANADAAIDDGNSVTTWVACRSFTVVGGA
ncbi:hypothetical protein RRSWK_04716 [Rhodopirellula sp. SWK7]|nr:hypothetical protein RRSWK_04716 [Rhodopirellula sp. SWK7]